MVHNEIIDQPGVDEFGSVTSATIIGNELWIGIFRGDQIAIFESARGGE